MPDVDEPDLLLQSDMTLKKKKTDSFIDCLDPDSPSTHWIINEKSTLFNSFFQIIKF